MGKQTEYLKGKEEFKNRILKYLKHREEGIAVMLHKGFQRTGEINTTVLEVLFVYKATISDIKEGRLDV